MAKMAQSNEYLPLLVDLLGGIDKGAFGADLAALNVAAVYELNNFLHVALFLHVDEGEATGKTSSKQQRKVNFENEGALTCLSG